MERSEETNEIVDLGDARTLTRGNVPFGTPDQDGVLAIPTPGLSTED